MLDLGTEESLDFNYGDNATDKNRWENRIYMGNNTKKGIERDEVII